eukprot:gene7174-11486_t
MDERKKHLETLKDSEKEIIKKAEEIQKNIDKRIEETEKKNEELTKKYEKIKEPLIKEICFYINGEKENSTKIPNYWLVVLKNSDLFSDINEKDELALKYLKNITIENESILNFEFEKNEYFQNTSLKKTFKEEKVISGTKIEWNEGKNLQLKRVLKKPKGKKKTNETPKIIEKYEPCDSFFNFFDKVEDEEIEEDDFIIFEELKETVLPNSVKYYLAEHLQDEEEDDSEDDEDEEEEGIVLTSEDY